MKNKIKRYKDKVKELEAKQEYIDKCNKLTFGTYTKRLVAIIIFFCLFNVQLSYVLAFLGKDPLTETTNQLITTILGTAVIYIVRAFFDTWSENKYNNKEVINELNSNIEELEDNTDSSDEQ